MNDVPAPHPHGVPAPLSNAESSPAPRVLPSDLKPSSSRLDRWSLGIAAASLIFSGLALWISIATEDDRGRRTAALRACETYAAGDAMRAITTDLATRVSRLKDGVMVRDYSPAYRENASVSVANAETRRLLTVWVNFFQVVATALDAGEYDFKISKSCFGPIMEHISAQIIGPSGKVFEKQDYDRVVYWANRFGNEK